MSSDQYFLLSVAEVMQKCGEQVNVSRETYKNARCLLGNGHISAILQKLFDLMRVEVTFEYYVVGLTCIKFYIDFLRFIYGFCAAFCLLLDFGYLHKRHFINALLKTVLKSPRKVSKYL